MEPEEFLAALIAYSYCFEDGDEENLINKLLDQCLFLRDKIDWLESQLSKAAAKEKKHEGKIKWLEKQLRQVTAPR